MDNTDQKRFFLFYVLIILAAFILRFIGLGSAALSENEARLALQSLSAIKGDPDFQIHQPLYVFVTSVNFFFFGANEFTARVFPAIMGFLLVFLPMLFQQKIGFQKTALLTFFVAIDPVGIAWSKTADSVIIVICLLFFAMAAFYQKRITPGIILLALAMTGGERFWPAALAMMVCLLIYLVFSHRKTFPDSIKDSISVKNLILLAVSFLLFSIGFFRFPQGLNAIGEGILSGFSANTTSAPEVVGLIPVLMGCIFYFGFMLLLLLLKFIQSLRSKQFSAIIPLLILLTFALLLGLFRQGILLLAWISLPLSILSADILIDLSGKIRIEKNIYSLLAIIILPCLYCFLIFRISELLQLGDLSLPVSFQWNQQWITISLTRFQGYLIIIGICLIIFGIFFPYLLNYFSPKKIWSSFSFGFLIIWFCSVVANSWSAAGFRYNQEDFSREKIYNRHELALGAQTNQINSLAVDLIHEIGLKESGFIEGANGLILNVDEPMLIWELRNNPSIQFADSLNPQTERPSYVITTDGVPDDLKKDFIGMPLKWKTQDEWNSFTLADWLRWMLYRQSKGNPFMLSFWQEPRWITEISQE